MDISILLSQMAVIFILLSIGFTAGKLNVITPDGNRALTKLVLYIALPCTILNSVLGAGFDSSFGESMYFLLMCFLSFALAFAVSIPIVKLSRGDKANHGLLTYMSVFSNCGFMGIPVALAVFGTASGFYTAIYNIPFNLLSFSVGILLIAGKKGKIDIRLLLNPPLVASVLAIPIAFSGFTVPVIVSDVLRITGGITTPGAMIVIGSTLSFIPYRNIFTQWRIAISSLLKLIIIPFLTWFVFKNLISDQLMLGVLVLLSAMPTAAQSTMFALEYDGDEKISSAGVLVTTLMCIITVPVLIYFLV